MDILTAVDMAITTTERANSPAAEALGIVRLMHLVSPSLPVGAFTYSQGIEWAVEAGWMRTDEDLERWLGDQLRHSIARLDLPLLTRMIVAAEADDRPAMEAWIDWLLAGRESTELRLEESQRGRAMADLLIAWRLTGAKDWKPVLTHSQTAGFAYAAAVWSIEPRRALLGYCWGWLENLVLSAIKIIPLGQTRGQQVLQRLAERIPETVEEALRLTDGEIGASSPALAIASSNHETQYTRIFRS